ncbi:MAG TPA: glutaredoxin 3 [Coxiellaceae bacterium]|nr:glutaredoxin 3 [Coxiellaceae bacterium]
MAKIEIYSKKNCPFCDHAKSLFDKKGVKYTEIRVDQDSARLEEMLTRAAGRRTVPEIFIDNRLIGGFDDLAALDKAGKLDNLLSNE